MFSCLLTISLLSLLSDSELCIINKEKVLELTKFYLKTLSLRDKKSLYFLNKTISKEKINLMHITLVVGTRPNFVKISPIIRQIQKKKAEGLAIEYSLVHTGQHYDDKMSNSFFKELNIPLPDFNLNVGSGSQAEQTGTIMVGFEKYLLQNPTDLVLVVGDVTSTMACSVTAKKLNIKLAHVEGGIRSFDRTMPEEINRLITDSITDYFFTTSAFANQNLLKEGIPASSVFFVGNVMIDTLVTFRSSFRKPIFFDKLNLKSKEYFVVTLHRPSNVDDAQNLSKIIQTIAENSNNKTIVFPVHPRTRAVIATIENIPDNIQFVEPLPYLEFNYLVEQSYAVITDSGGVTEETTYMKIPCLTLRDNTERPETCSIGTNVLVGSDPNNLTFSLKNLYNEDYNNKSIPELWDGKTSERIINHIIALFQA